MPSLSFTLHKHQLDVLNSPATYKVVVAGRRGGKSFLAKVMIGVYALDPKLNKGKDIFYVAPTFQQARDIMWSDLKEMWKDVITDVHENTSCLTFKGGCKVYLKGSDRPDTLRGVGLSFVVMDEYATMKPEVWEEILFPTLGDVEGHALFIGTPAGKNHFFDLFIKAQKLQEEGDPEWAAFSFLSADNPTLSRKFLQHAKATMSSTTWRQEMEASFETFSGGIFTSDMIRYADRDEFDGSVYIAVDPAGYEEVGQVENHRLDEFAIAVVLVHTKGWHILDVIHGRWGVREASIRILRAAQKYNPISIGIEKGSLKNALMPYLEDQMRRLNCYPHVEEVTHGGKKKAERIAWALQGRFEHGRITIEKGEWNSAFEQQLIDFPAARHDDLVDAVAYIDQVAITDYANSIELPEWEPYDEISGY